ncbi:MAG: sigma-54-dependent Fis family transcriptional regulator [Phycisphaerae bacterium]|nr:sigma-54-dependent Fis family transcriptional regulator [Phycisphaerae bacterium]
MSDRPRVLVVDDDPIVAESIAELLRSEAYDATSALGANEAMEIIAADETRPIGIVVCDVNMPQRDGMSLLGEVAEKRPDIAMIMLTGYGSIESAVDALRRGAVDYLTKPVMDDELRLSLERAMRQSRLASENKNLKQQLEGRFGLSNIVGRDQRMQRVYELVEAVAPSRTTVLMEGESGTGKSLIARAIHQNSPRAEKPFVEISCGSIPETLLESELFGHVKGAFTGAHADKVGRFKAADGGTIFLDEINSASPGMQLKLLRALQERRFEPVGSTETIEVDTRVILAANQPLEALVASGAFRQDLYYRVNVVKIQLPPLRERVSDIPMLAQHFLHKHAEELGKTVTGFDAAAMDALRRYTFPGNVRELANIVERATVLCRGEVIGATDLPPELITGEGGSLAAAMRAHSGGDDEPWAPMSLVEAMKAPERRILLKALEANDWNRQQTAEQLEINRTTLYKKMKAYGIEEPRRAG